MKAQHVRIMFYDEEQKQFVVDTISESMVEDEQRTSKESMETYTTSSDVSVSF